MDGDQFREAVSESRRRLAAHQRSEQMATEVTADITMMTAGLVRMAVAMQRADRASLMFAEAFSEDSWMRQEDAARWTPDSEGNDQDG